MKTPIYNYSKLQGRIRERFGTQKEFAEAMEISAASLSQKLNNSSTWTQIDIQKAIAALGLDPGDIVPYFFDQKVQ